LTHPYGKRISLVVTETSYGYGTKHIANTITIKEGFDRPSWVANQAIKGFLKQGYITGESETIENIIRTILEFYRDKRVAWCIAKFALSFDNYGKPRIEDNIEIANISLTEVVKDGVHSNTD
jgi:hypothetical protein